MGIRRVFWTNHEGDWEGGKVQDLVDALGLKDASADDSEDIGASMFVTKHEILMLGRLMDDTNQGLRAASRTTTI